MRKIDAKDRQFGLRLDGKMVEAMEAIAVVMDRSVSWLIRKACDDFVEAHRGKKPEQPQESTAGTYSVQLEPQAALMLETVSRASGKPTTELLRQAVDLFLDRNWAGKKTSK